ncbi:MAG: replication initiator protein WhiP [Crenarchaeota archaeon]|nr:replication initiator protein WhiP [Thermoproteota archaeon]
MKRSDLLETIEPTTPSELVHAGTWEVRGPRSKVAEAILLLLYSRPMRSREIAEKLGKSSRYVASYLSYWRTRGVVDYRGGYWFLTRRGEEIVRTILDAKRLREEEQLSHTRTTEPVSGTINDKSRQAHAKASGAVQSFIVEQTSAPEGKQWEQDPIGKALRCLDTLLGDRDLEEEEYAVLRHMVKHYAEWGSTYLYVDQIAEDLHYEMRELLQILRRLQTKKLIYMYTDKRLGIRVGLGRGLKQAIDKCLGKR